MATSDSSTASTEASTSDTSTSDAATTNDADEAPPIQRGVRRVARARRDADHHNTIELAPPFRFSC